MKRESGIYFFLTICFLRTGNDLLKFVPCFTRNSSLYFFSSAENVLKCYMCTSLSNEDCNSDLITNTLQPTECTADNMVEWQKRIQQHKLFNPITWVFEIDESHYQNKITSDNMACAKMVLNSKYVKDLAPSVEHNRHGIQLVYANS